MNRSISNSWNQSFFRISGGVKTDVSQFKDHPLRHLALELYRCLSADVCMSCQVHISSRVSGLLGRSFATRMNKERSSLGITAFRREESTETPFLFEGRKFFEAPFSRQSKRDQWTSNRFRRGSHATTPDTPLLSPRTQVVRLLIPRTAERIDIRSLSPVTTF